MRPNLLTVKDIQEIFKCGRRQAYNLVNSKGFPAMRLEKKILVSEDALDKWIKNQTGKTYYY